MVVGDDPDDVYEFCVVISMCESFVLKEMADERKRQIAIAKRKAGNK